MRNNSYTLFFAAIITISCSLLLALASSLLRERQEENLLLDMQKNILAAYGVLKLSDKNLNKQEIQNLYADMIKEIVVNAKGEVIQNKKPGDIDFRKNRDLFPLYLAFENGNISAYIIPVSGKGLWSTIYGQVALETDLNTIKGITFYKHGETPGLGGEIDQEWFTDNFKGKKLFKDKELLSVTIVKGKVTDKNIQKEDLFHYVDGISGATLTGNGINDFLKKNIIKYLPYFEKVQNSKSEHNNAEQE